MQTVSAAFTTATSATGQLVAIGVLIAWTKQINPSFQFFKIGTSLIGGPDFIPSSSATAPAYLDKYQYFDYSDYALSWSVTRNMGQFPYGTFGAEGDVVLDNTSLLFMPGYDGLIGNFITVGRPIKIATGFGSETINLITGLTTQPQNDVQNRIMTLQSFDGMDYINMFISQAAGSLTVNGLYFSTPGSPIYFDQIIGDLLEEVGFSVTDFVLEQSLQGPVGYMAPYGQSVGDMIQQICEAEQGLFFFDENGVAHFWNRQHIANNNTVQWTFDETTMVNFQPESTTLINDVTVQAQPRAVQTNQIVWQSTSSYEVLAGTTLDVFVDFSDDNGALPIVQVDTPVFVTSATTSFYTTSYDDTTDGSINDGSQAFITVSSTFLFGTTYRVSFQNSSTNTSVFISTMTIYGEPATVTAVINQEYTSPSSIQLYGTNPSNNGQPLVIQNDLIQDSDTALADAYKLVNDYSIPYTRATADVFSVPQLQIGDYVTVALQDTGVTNNYTVVGITTTSSTDDFLAQSLELEVKVLVKYFQINVSKIGSTDQISP